MDLLSCSFWEAYLCSVNYPSKLVEAAVEEFSQLPGVGRKTALRLVLHLLKQERPAVERFGNTLIRLRQEIRFCESCHNLSDTPVCSICSHPKRDKGLVCVVEDARDVMAIENTSQYNGLYHVLGGLISPMDGIGPADLSIDDLLARIKSGEIREVIMALSATVEGDTTVFYIHKKMQGQDVIFSTIARGISFGGELEYVDEVTLGRSIATRVPYEQTLRNS